MLDSQKVLSTFLLEINWVCKIIILLVKQIIFHFMCVGPDHKNVLQRVLEKSKLVKRASVAAYGDLENIDADKTAQELMQELPERQFLSGVSNSRNANEGDFNRKLNHIIGHNLQSQLLPKMTEVIGSTTRHREKTANEIAAEKAKKDATNAKRRQTLELNRQNAINAAVAVAQANANPPQVVAVNVNVAAPSMSLLAQPPSIPSNPSSNTSNTAPLLSVPSQPIILTNTQPLVASISNIPTDRNDVSLSNQEKLQLVNIKNYFKKNMDVNYKEIDVGSYVVVKHQTDDDLAGETVAIVLQDMPAVRRKRMIKVEVLGIPEPREYNITGLLRLEEKHK